MGIPDWTFALIAFCVFFVFYVIWIGPMFRASDPEINYLRINRGKLRGKSRAHDLTFWERVRYKLAGLKQKLFTAMVVMAGTIVLLYDLISPVLGNVDYTPITSRVDPKWMVAINIAVPLILLFFRKLAERRERV